MSRSPKYSFAQLGRQVHEQLRHEQSARRRRRAEAVERDRARARAAAADLDRAVAAASGERAARRRAAVARLDELTARLATLEDDARTARLRVLDGDRAADALDVLRKQIVAGDVAEVLRLCARLEQRLDASEAALDAAIDQITQRRAILSSLIRALPGVGFAVDRGSLTENADGAVALRAVRAGGDTMAIVVEPRDGEHRVLYDSDRLVREQRQGRGEAACAQLVEVIDELQAAAVHDGVVLGTVSWDGRDRPVPPSALRRPPAEQVKQQKGQPWAR